MYQQHTTFLNPFSIILGQDGY